MSEKVKLSIESREPSRREIEQQVKEFLSKGGSIEQLPQSGVSSAKPIGNVWRPAYGSFEQ